jgi:hypothetical protein
MPRNVTALLSADKAVLVLLQYIDRNSARVHRAIHYARSYVHQSNLPSSSDDAVQFILNTCRDDIFDSSLVGVRVKISKSLPRGFSGNISMGSSTPQLSVNLNHCLVELLWRKVTYREDLVALILHHLIHAYLVVKCGSPQVPAEVSEVFGHGIHFSALLFKIKEVSKTDFVLPLPMTAGFPIAVCQHDQQYRQHLPTYDVVSHGHGCTALITDLPLAEVKDWIKTKSAKLPGTTIIYQLGKTNNDFIGKPLSEYGNSTAFKLLKWQDKHYHLPSPSLSTKPDLAALFKGGAQTFNLPQSITESQLKHFITFCHRGTYGTALSISQSTTGTSPALLLPVKPTTRWPAILKTDIEMFYMGAAIPLPALKNAALARLNAHHFTHEDPINVLSAIFTTATPSDQLIEWLGRWIRRTDELRPSERRIAGSNWAKIDVLPRLEELLVGNGGVQLCALWERAREDLNVMQNRDGARQWADELQRPYSERNITSGGRGGSAAPYYSRIHYGDHVEFHGPVSISVPLQLPQDVRRERDIVNRFSTLGLDEEDVFVFTWP